MIANANMMRALNGVTSERGRDPAKFSLFAIGGNGGVHAGQLAETMRITRVLVPPVAGLFSALGMLFADVEHRLVSAFYHRHSAVTADLVNRAAQPLIAEAQRLLASEGYADPSQQRIALQADLKHVAQTGVLTIAFERYPVDAGALAALAESFLRAHLEAYGYRSDGEPIQLVVLKVVAQGVSAAARVPKQVVRGNEPSTPATERRAYFGAQAGWLPVPVLGRAGLSIAPRDGPLIVEEYDTTTLVRPGWRARLDSWNNIVIERATA
jgi:N-methylhydantoinase A